MGPGNAVTSSNGWPTCFVLSLLTLLEWSSGGSSGQRDSVCYKVLRFAYFRGEPVQILKQEKNTKCSTLEGAFI